MSTVLDRLGNLEDRAVRYDVPRPGAEQHITRLQTIWHRTLQLLSTEHDFVLKKFLDHRNLTVVMLSIYGVAAPGLWIWDYATDPIGAQNTILLRLLYLSCFAMGAAFFFYSSIRALSIISCLWILICELVFVEILNRLDGGMTYGIGGFMFFMLASVVFSQCFPLYINIVMAFSLALLPHLLGIAGIAHNFQHLHYAVLIWPATFVVIFMQFMITQNYLRRYELEQQLELAANTDPLTGVSNRRYFMQYFAQEMVRVRRSGQPLSLLMLDIDHFKVVNDTYGHPTGDVVIRKVADICRIESRAVDVVARFGGEEFAVLLTGTDEQGAIAVAERIRALAEATTVKSPDGKPFHFTVSVGVTELGFEEPDEGPLLARVDTALYEAKTSGRNRVKCISSKVKKVKLHVHA